MRLTTKYVLIVISGAVLLPLFLWQCRSNTAGNPLIEVVSPADNPTSPEKIALGRKLFFDKRLSKDESISCSSCHLPQFAFTDRKKVSEGVAGRKTLRNSPSLLNSGFLKTVMFDAHLQTLELQVIAPIQEHVEMDMLMIDLIKRLRKIEEYQKAAKDIFGRDFDAFVLTRSIAAFERSLISMNSRFDKFYYHDQRRALTASEKRGWDIFSRQLYCTKCHPAPYFTTFVAENNGLYLEYGEDKGRFRIDNDSLDIGKFKVPSLRNIELTFPYMHDGSLKSLEEVIAHYSKGGEAHPLKNPAIRPFQLDKQEIVDLKAFLFSLTDTSYMKDFR